MISILQYFGIFDTTNAQMVISSQENHLVRTSAHVSINNDHHRDEDKTKKIN